MRSTQEILFMMINLNRYEDRPVTLHYIFRDFSIGKTWIQHQLDGGMKTFFHDKLEGKPWWHEVFGVKKEMALNDEWTMLIGQVAMNPMRRWFIVLLSWLSDQRARGERRKKRKYPDLDQIGQNMSSDESDYFEPLVVLQFSSSTPNLTKDWVIRRLTDDRQDDEGAGFLVRWDKDPESRVNHWNKNPNDPSDVDSSRIEQYFVNWCNERTFIRRCWRIEIEKMGQEERFKRLSRYGARSLWSFRWEKFIDETGSMFFLD